MNVRYTQRPLRGEDTLTGYSEIVKKILTQRGITSNKEAEDLVSLSYDEGLHDPFLMKDMDRAVGRVVQALKNNEKIAVFSDYDADGVPGGVLLVSFLERVGFKDVISYIPHRGREGFGLNKEAIDELISKEVRLILTVDCGVTDISEVLYAQKSGVDVIVTDHHLPSEELPPAYAILNPKQDGCTYPFKELCGTGVAYKFVQACITRDEIDFPLGHEKWLLDLVGIATLADMVPIVGENRVLARYGLVVLKKGRRSGLRELLSQARVDYRFLSEEDVTFTIAPRINAAGRMAHPDIAFGLLSSQGRGDALKRALELENINNERKKLVASIVREVKKKISGREERSVLVVGSPDWKPGILGLIASSLVDSFGKPAFVWGREVEGPLKGSVRSDGVTNVYDLMKRIPDGILTSFGGHEKSAGFVVELDKVDLLEEALNTCATEGGVETCLGREYDAELTPKDLNGNLFEDVLSFAPYGVGFDKPVFKIANVTVLSVKEFGKSKNHLEISFDTDEGRMTSIGFFMTRKNFDFDISEGSVVSLFGSLEKSFYRRVPEYRIRIEHIEA